MIICAVSFESCTVHGALETQLQLLLAFRQVWQNRPSFTCCMQSTTLQALKKYCLLHRLKGGAARCGKLNWNQWVIFRWDSDESVAICQLSVVWYIGRQIVNQRANFRHGHHQGICRLAFINFCDLPISRKKISVDFPWIWHGGAEKDMFNFVQISNCHSSGWFFATFMAAYC